MNEPLPLENQKRICLNPKVMDQIASLRKAGTTGVLLADKAEAIICRLKSGEAWQADRKIAPRTAHGEKRIRKCVKYDLGWGFRLITILRKNCLFICYLGPHDECDRWLAENSRLKDLEAGKWIFCRMVAPKPIKEVAQPEDFRDGTDDLDYRLQELPDRLLRRIFCGLVEARKRPPASKATRFSGTCG